MGAIPCLQGDVVFLKVNKLSSVKTQLPYEYYSLPYCRPEKIVPFAENLGEVLRGDRIENSLYQVRLPWLGMAFPSTLAQAQRCRPADHVTPLTLALLKLCALAL